MPPELAGSALLIGLLVVGVVAALCMSWSDAQDPKLTLLASLMRKSPRAVSGDTTTARVQKTKCRY
jgi:hypothetical protein